MTATSPLRHPTIYSITRETDDYEPPQAQHPIEQTIRDAGHEETSYVCPNTGRWFVEPSRTDAYNADAADLLWTRTVEFLRVRLD
ncbi:MAG: hypothetical protein R2839_12015 [Thermomicrobiales bacterium]